MITLVELKRLIALVVALASTPVTSATNGKHRYQVKEPYTPLSTSSVFNLANLYCNASA